ncbi:MAG: hypothetical protein AVDCRST_MAG59-4418 [uncultured Thermomicrobiales bacterium]|uniref:Uncharacterized protein n=1 Tax=uncultured Thermomicrobiales bacterium TaxID=1645740 RepID=A0A6J4VK10_9BACT|nr:MAG: hypothetical protein AVDCRST_MAG59-4418 [uncultured Thermomicrobiales bacterium]
MARGELGPESEAIRRDVVLAGLSRHDRFGMGLESVSDLSPSRSAPPSGSA